MGTVVADQVCHQNYVKRAVFVNQRGGGGGVTPAEARHRDRGCGGNSSGIDGERCEQRRVGVIGGDHRPRGGGSEQGGQARAGAQLGYREAV